MYISSLSLSPLVAYLTLCCCGPRYKLLQHDGVKKRRASPGSRQAPIPLEVDANDDNEVAGENKQLDEQPAVGKKRNRSSLKCDCGWYNVLRDKDGVLEIVGCCTNHTNGCDPCALIQRASQIDTYQGL